jgi:hypothetical protein
VSAFSAELNVIGTSLGVPTEEQLEAGAEPNLEVNLIIGQTLPFSPGPGQPPVVAPLGQLTYRLAKDMAVEFFKKGIEAAEDLPEPSKLAVATDLASAEQAAQQLDRLRGSNDK